MSSFINSPKHFSTIKYNLSRYLFNFSNPVYLPYSMADKYRKIYDKSYFIEEREKALKEQIDNFAQLQALCVNLQYKHHSTNLDQDIEVSTKEVVKDVESEKVSKTALLKLIQCSFYQLETEYLKELRGLNKDEKESIDFLRQIQDALMQDIICNSEEYNKSKWSI